MGSYNSQYEEYYNSLRKKSRAAYTPYHRNYFTSDNKEKKSGSNYWSRKIVFHLIGVLILFVFVIVCKTVNSTTTTEVYSFSKKLVNENYDYRSFFNKAKYFDVKKFQGNIMDYIENIKNKTTGKDVIGDRIKDKFILPLKGVETSAFGYRKDPVTKKNKFHAGVDIDAKMNTPVMASYDGKVEKCDEDNELGKYILIDHGEGLETKYCHLNKILVKREDVVKKSQIIAKSGNTGKSTGPHLHFEILYMGENKDPNEYFHIDKN